MGGSKTTTSNTIDPKLMALYQQNYNTAQGVANRPYQPYTGEGVAPFTPAQTASQAQLSGVATNPIYGNEAQGATTAAQGVLGNIQNTPTLAGTNLSPYENPYTESVIDATLKRLEQQRGMQRVSDNQAATQQDAFGGNRQGVADALTNGQYDLNDANVIAALNSANFGQAQSAAQYDINRGLIADQLGLTGATDVANLANNQFSLAANQGGLLNNVGAQQQQQQQNQDQWLYQQFLNQWNYPVQQQDIRNAALGLIPLQQTTTSKQSSSPLGGILGGLGSIASIAGSFA